MNFIINATDELATRSDYTVSNESRQMKRLPADCPVKFNVGERMHRDRATKLICRSRSLARCFASTSIVQLSIFIVNFACFFSFSKRMTDPLIKILLRVFFFSIVTYWDNLKFDERKT